MNVAIIPARSGSKGVPNKNIHKLWGKSLIGWAADCAKETGLYDHILLSTDSEEYANEGKKHGCRIPFLRPANLASDSSNINFVLIDLLNKIPDSKNWKTITLLEPTCPLRTPELVKMCFDQYLEKENIHSCITVNEVPVKYNPYKQFIVGDEGFLSFVAPLGKNVVNRQELPKTYTRNGAAYVINVHEFLKTSNIIGEDTIPFVCSNYLINIDNSQDIEELRQFEKSHTNPWN